MHRLVGMGTTPPSPSLYLHYPSTHLPPSPSLYLHYPSIPLPPPPSIYTTPPSPSLPLPLSTLPLPPPPSTYTTPDRWFTVSLLSPDFRLQFPTLEQDGDSSVHLTGEGDGRALFSGVLVNNSTTRGCCVRQWKE